jgi:predicted TIM-barrel fold metal-dependent hydrolase
MSDGAIDVHAHFLPTIYRESLRDAGLTLLDGGMPVPDWSEDRALAIMDEVGIAGAMLSISSPHASFLGGDKAAALCRAINDEAAAIKARHPSRFGAYAILPLPDMAASLSELDRALDQLGLDGVALPTHADGAYLGDAKFWPLLEALNARAASVFIHPTSPCCFEAFGLGLPAPMIEFPFDTTRTAASLLYSGALARFDAIRFILPHAGGTLPFLAPRMAAIGGTPVLGERATPPAAAMEAFAKLHYDTALSTTPQQIAALRALTPLDHIVFGTDFPFAPEIRLRGDAAAFTQIFTPEEQLAVRQTNPARLFAPFAHRCLGHAHP